LFLVCYQCLAMPIINKLSCESHSPACTRVVLIVSLMKLGTKPCKISTTSVLISRAVIHFRPRLASFPSWSSCWSFSTRSSSPSKRHSSCRRCSRTSELLTEVVLKCRAAIGHGMLSLTVETFLSH
jgi:hypothetical protein